MTRNNLVKSQKITNQNETRRSALKQEIQSHGQELGTSPTRLTVDTHLSKVQRQQIVQQIGFLNGNYAVQRILQLRRTRHTGVLDNGVLNQDVNVILGNLSGTLPRSTYVEVTGGGGDKPYQVKVWSGYGGQDASIPVGTFTHTSQRHDREMDRVDIGTYGRIPKNQRLPFASTSIIPNKATRHEGVLDNGVLKIKVDAKLGGLDGTLPIGTYVEVVQESSDKTKRVVRVWSGFGGQETVLPAELFRPSSFNREQRSDRKMDDFNINAYSDIPFDKRLPLANLVRLRVIDNGVLTKNLDTNQAFMPLLLAGTYVEVLEYRNDIVVIRPGSGMRDNMNRQERFVTADRNTFRTSFRQQPQVTDNKANANSLQYSERKEPLWGPAGPQLEDIKQGYVGTCGVLASAGALLRQRPGIITDKIFQGNTADAPTFKVYLYPKAAAAIFNGGTETASEVVEVTVDRYLPTWALKQGDLLAYAKASPALWPAVLEKAFAQVFRGYDNFDRGTVADAVMGVLTGDVSPSNYKSPRNISPSEMSAERLLTLLEILHRRKAAVTFLTPPPQGYLNQRLRIFGWHYYVFTGLAGDKIHLYNPYGTGHPQPLTISQVRQYFSDITFRAQD